MNFSGRVTIVTGASQGIGEAIASELAMEGAEIVLIDVQKEKLDEVAQRIERKKEGLCLITRMFPAWIR